MGHVNREPRTRGLQVYHYRKSRPEHLNPVRPIDTRRGRRVNRLFSYHRYWQEPNMKLGWTVFCPETVLRSVYGSRLRGVFHSPLRLHCQADFCQAIMSGQNLPRRGSQSRVCLALRLIAETRVRAGLEFSEFQRSPPKPATFPFAPEAVYRH
jgi:hypothetical protein